MVKGVIMFKITLYDNNCCPISDVTFSFFVDDLENFEKHWLPLQARHDVETIDRYYRSKHGEVIADYCTEDPTYNIVQEDKNAEICEERSFTYEDYAVKLYNTYRCSTDVEFDNLTIALRKIRYEGKYILVGGYVGKGGKRLENRYIKASGETIKYSQMEYYGNNIAIYFKRKPDWNKMFLADAYRDFYTNDKDFYKDEVIETFVWLPIKDVTKNYKIKELTEVEISTLLRDIVGEAG